MKKTTVLAFVTGLGLLVWSALLAWFALDPNAPVESLRGDTGTSQQARILLFLAVMLCGYILYLLGLRSVARGCLAGTWPWLLAFCLLARLPLLPTPLIMETDIYRYLWDGRVVLAGENPYRYSPAEVRDGGHESRLARLAGIAEAPKWAEVLDNVNNPNVPTIYFPAAQYVFALSVLLFGPSVTGMKFVFFLFDAGVLVLLALWLKRSGRAPEWALVWGACPLVLKEIANTGHYDVVAVFFVVLAFYLRTLGRPRAAIASLAIGALCKFYPILLLPLFLDRDRLRRVAVFVAVGLLMYVPFLRFGTELAGGWGTFSTRWEMNSGLVSLLEESVVWLTGWGAWGASPGWTLNAFQLAKGVGLVVFLVAWLLLLRHYRLESSDERRAAASLWILGILLLCSPVANPWYLVWLVPFLAFRPSPVWLTWIVTVQLYYLYFFPASGHGYVYLWEHRISDVRWLEYLPVYGLLVWEGGKCWKMRQKRYCAGREIMP